MSKVKWITTTEAVALSGYDPEYIRRLVRTEKVQAKKFGVIWQINQKALIDYCKESGQSEDKRRGPKSNS